MSKKSELHAAFQQTLTQMQERLGEYVREGDTNSAYMMVHRISGATIFAMKLGIVEREQYTSIEDEAMEAARQAGKEETA